MVDTTCLPYQSLAVSFSYKMVFSSSKGKVAYIFWLNLLTATTKVIFCCCFCSVAQLCWLCETPWTGVHGVFATCRAPLSFTISGSLLKLMSIGSVMSNHFILCRLPLLLPSILLRIRVFSNESTLCIRWPKYWSFSFNISPSNEYSGLISFRIDCFNLLVVQGTLKSLLQHHSLKALILRHSAFFMVQLSHPYMT